MLIYENKCIKIVSMQSNSNDTIQIANEFMINKNIFVIYKY